MWPTKKSPLGNTTKFLTSSRRQGGWAVGGGQSEILFFLSQWAEFAQDTQNLLDFLLQISRFLYLSFSLNRGTSVCWFSKKSFQSPSTIQTRRQQTAGQSAQGACAPLRRRRRQGHWPSADFSRRNHCPWKPRVLPVTVHTFLYLKQQPCEAHTHFPNSHSGASGRPDRGWMLKKYFLKKCLQKRVFSIHLKWEPFWNEDDSLFSEYQ